MTKIVATPIIGYRQWCFLDGRLLSLQAFIRKDQTFGHVEWFLDRTVAMSYEQRKSAVPSMANSIGLHARKHLHYAAPGYAHLPVPGYKFNGRVAGSVIMWGQIVEHTLGYRAQYAKPIGFLDHPQWPDAREAAEIYGIPALPGEELIAYASWWGTSDVSN